MPVVPFIPVIIAAVGAGAAAYQGKRAGDRQSAALDRQVAATRSLAPPPIPTGPTVTETEAADAKRAKEAASKRTAANEAAIRQRTIMGLAETVKTSPSGLTGRTTVEKKTLLGQ